MTPKLLAVVIAGALASGCTLVVPGITYGAHSTPRHGDVAAAQRRSRDTMIGLCVGVVVDIAALAVLAHYDAFGAAGGD